MDHLSNMKIDLSKETNNKLTYDLTDHFMVDIDTIIAIPFVTYIIDLDAYELHRGDEEIFNNFINEC